jgi:hypothetical protein
MPDSQLQQLVQRATQKPFSALTYLLLQFDHNTVRAIPLRITRGGDITRLPVAALANFIYFTIEFKSSQSRPDRERRRPSLLTHSVPPALTHFRFRSVNEYLEDLVACGPHRCPLAGHPLDNLLPLTDTSRLARFMRFTIKFKILNEARVFLNKDNVVVDFFPPIRTFDIVLVLIFSCSKSDWQLLSSAQVRTSLPYRLYGRVPLTYIDEDRFSKQY